MIRHRLVESRKLYFHTSASPGTKIFIVSIVERSRKKPMSVFIILGETILKHRYQKGIITIFWRSIYIARVATTCSCRPILLYGCMLSAWYWLWHVVADWHAKWQKSKDGDRCTPQIKELLRPPFWLWSAKHKADGRCVPSAKLNMLFILTADLKAEYNDQSEDEKEDLDSTKNSECSADNWPDKWKGEYARFILLEK